MQKILHSSHANTMNTHPPFNSIVKMPIVIMNNITEATWDYWSSWSECTSSCGSGYQTRQRHCLNQMNTTDGYVTECEGKGTVSRPCHAECPCT